MKLENESLISANGTSYINKWDDIYQQMGRLTSENKTKMGQYISTNGTIYITKWDKIYQHKGQYISPMGQHISTNGTIYTKVFSDIKLSPTYENTSHV